MSALFITGASGFLGSRILRQLDPADYTSITLMCRGNLTLPPLLAGAANVTVVQAALDEVDLYASCLGPDTRVVHLAAITGKAAREEYFDVNTRATGLLIKAAEAAGVAGFLFASSIAVSFRDRQGYHYAESKQQAERLLEASKLRYCIIRPTIILGEDSPIWQSFFALARRPVIVLPGTGRVRIQPIDVDDLVRLIADITDRDRFNNEVLEIGGPDTLTMDEFVRRIHMVYRGKQPHIVHLPLALVLVPLRILERFIPSLLPVSSAQFASFNNDGTVTANELVRPVAGELAGIEEMLERLVGNIDNG